MVKLTKKVKKVEEKQEVKEEVKQEVKEEKELDEVIAEVEEKMEQIGQVQTPVFQKSAFIKTKVYTTPVPLYELPDELRQYLINMGFGTNVYEKGEEWLHAHWADMEKIEELKKFISEHFRK